MYVSDRYSACGRAHVYILCLSRRHSGDICAKRWQFGKRSHALVNTRAEEEEPDVGQILADDNH